AKKINNKESFSNKEELSKNNLPTLKKRKTNADIVQPIETSPRAKSTSSGLGFLFGINYNSNYMIGNDLWTEEQTGVGFTQGFGGNAYAEIIVGGALGLKFSGGYSMWGVRRNTERIKNEIVLSNIPLNGALKIYLTPGFYLFGEGSYNLMNVKNEVDFEGDVSTFETSENHIGFGGGLGFNFNISQFIFSVSGRYHIINVDNVSNPDNVVFPSEQIHFMGLQLALAFPAK
ncbi:MAG: outer membrane beta-barrel protein, partial [Bacteroidota bacterium]